MKQTFCAEPLAEDEAAAGSGAAEAADALSKSSKAPEEVREQQVRGSTNLLIH